MKTRIIYIGYNLKEEEKPGLFLSLIDRLGIHLDLEPSFVDAVLLKMSTGVGRRDPSPKRFLDLHLEGADWDWIGRSMDATICIKGPDLEGTSSVQFRKFHFRVDISLECLVNESTETIFIFFNDYPISWGTYLQDLKSLIVLFKTSAFLAILAVRGCFCAPLPL
jgi:hypothetical protein